LKILKTDNIKGKIVEWLKSVYPEHEIDDKYSWTTIRMKDVSSVDLSYIARRQIRIKGDENVYRLGGGVMFGGRHDGSMIIHGGAKAYFGIFDEVELKRRIDARFKKKIEEKEESKKAEQTYKDKINTFDPFFTACGFVKDNRYSWQTTWNFNEQIHVSLRNGGGLAFELKHSNVNEEQVKQIAKLAKELLNGETNTATCNGTSNPNGMP
jgi:hypothetical protein